MENKKVSDLEKEFKNTYEIVYPQIEAKLKMAHDALEEALQLADNFGIPFYSGTSTLGQNYVPHSFGEKFGKLNLAEIEEIVDIDKNDLGAAKGWWKSELC